MRRFPPYLSLSWRLSVLQQREGRIINDNPEVDIYSYVTEQTFDAYLYFIRMCGTDMVDRLALLD